MIGCLTLADVCNQRGIHMTYYGTGWWVAAGGAGLGADGAGKGRGWGRLVHRGRLAVFSTRRYQSCCSHSCAGMPCMTASRHT